MKKIKSKLKITATTVFDCALQLLILFSCACIAFVMLIVTADVVSREFFNYPIEWVLEISQLILPAIVFLGAAWLLKNEGHVAMDVVVSRLSTRGQALLNAVTSIIGVIICTLLLTNASLAVGRITKNSPRTRSKSLRTTY